MPTKKKKSTRRANNEGSLYQHSSDGLWVGVVTAEMEDGTTKRMPPVYGKTQSVALRKMVELRQKIAEKGHIVKVHKTEFKERNFRLLFSDWFTTYYAPTMKSSASEELHRCRMRNHIFPKFENLDVTTITKKNVQDFFNDKVRKSGLSIEYIRRIKQLMTHFFNYMVVERVIEKEDNPMVGIIIASNRDEKLGEGKKITAKALRPEIRAKIFSLIMSHPVLKPIIITFTFTGLRPQELIGIDKNKHLNLHNKTISVERALKRTYKHDDEGNVVSRGAVLGETKTPSSEREFLLPNIVVQAIEEWFEYCKENGIDSDFLFPTKDGKMRTYAGLLSLLKRFLKKHGLDKEGISLKTFRHTFATMLLEQRENPKIVATLMGHKKVGTTLNIYSHVINAEVFEKTCNTLDAVYEQFNVVEILENPA